MLGDAGVDLNFLFPPVLDSLSPVQRKSFTYRGSLLGRWCSPSLLTGNSPSAINYSLILCARRLFSLLLLDLGCVSQVPFVKSFTPP